MFNLVIFILLKFLKKKILFKQILKCFLLKILQYYINFFFNFPYFLYLNQIEGVVVEVNADALIIHQFADDFAQFVNSLKAKKKLIFFFILNFIKCFIYYIVYI